MTIDVEFRCDLVPPEPWRQNSRLFGKMLGALPVRISENLFEFACPDCKRVRYPDARRVVHRFEIDGTLVETVPIYD